MNPRHLKDILPNVLTLVCIGFVISLLIYAFRNLSSVLAFLGWPSSGLVYTIVRPITFGFAFSFSLIGFRVLWSIATRLYATKPQALLLRDRRPPILYLRSFQDDVRSILHEVVNFQTYEKHLVRVLRKFGPIWALGSPQDNLPPSGALRVYEDGENWKLTVTEIMKKARFVVIVPRMGEGVFWEISTALEIMRPEQILIAIPENKNPKHGITAGERLELLKYWLNQVLPVAIESIPQRASFITFNSDWQPQYLVSSRRHWYHFFYGSQQLSPRLLRQFVERLGMRVSSTVSILRQVSKVLLVIILFLAASLYFYPIVDSLFFSINPWETYRNDQAGFSVAFPGEPTESVSKRSKLGIKSSLHAYRYELEGAEIVFDVSYFDLPFFVSDAFVVKRMLRGARDGMLYYGKSELVYEENINTGHFPEKKIEVRFRKGGFIGFSRLLLTGRRFYMVSVVLNEEYHNPVLISRFMDSFEITVKPAREQANDMRINEVLKKIFTMWDDVAEVKKLVSGLSLIEAEIKTGELVEKGLRRFDDELLMHRAALIAELLLSADTSTCAKLGFQNLPSTELAVVLSKLDDDSVDFYIGLSQTAALFEIKNSPPVRSISNDDYDKAFAVFMESLSGEPSVRMQTLMDLDPAQWSDSDACWMVRTLYNWMNRSETHSSRIIALGTVLD